MWSLRVFLVAVVIVAVRFRLSIWENFDFRQRGREVGLFVAVMGSFGFLGTFWRGRPPKVSRSDRIMEAAQRAHRARNGPAPRDRSVTVVEAVGGSCAALVALVAFGAAIFPGP